MKTEWKLDFGRGEAEHGYVKVQEDTIYTPEIGFGFAPQARVSSRRRGEPGGLLSDFCIPVDSAFVVDLPNGRYAVSLMAGDAIAPTETTVKSGPGRLMVQKARTSAGQFVRHSFTVLVEDGQLRLAFSGLAPRINSLEIAPAPNAPVLFLAGDSTVTDEREDNFPYAGWGQMLPRWLKSDVAVANHAKSGRSSKSFISEGRLDAILRLILPNDFLLVQFGHNDQKPDEERHTDPFTSYKEHLSVYIDSAREKGAIPILLTSVHRRFFDRNGKLVDTHGDYLEGVRQLAAEKQVPLIDLADRSKALYESLGPEETKSVFMWAAPGEFIPFPGGAEDNTHFQEQGAIRIAKLVADGIKELRIVPLMLYVR